MRIRHFLARFVPLIRYHNPKVTVEVVRVKQAPRACVTIGACGTCVVEPARLSPTARAAAGGKQLVRFFRLNETEDSFLDALPHTRTYRDGTVITSQGDLHEHVPKPKNKAAEAPVAASS